MEKEENPLKIARVSRAIEKAIGVSFTSDVSVYMHEKTLNLMAEKMSDKYLHVIEEVGEIIKKPDYVRFDDTEGSLIFLKEFIHGYDLVKVAVAIKKEGRPKRFFFKSLTTLDLVEIRHLNEEIMFVKLY